MKEFEEGEKVLIQYHPSVQSGRVHSRFHGTTAEVTGRQGDAVTLQLKDGGKMKTLHLKPVHIKKLDEEE
jgi:large subunit ribosomal protein L21e